MSNDPRIAIVGVSLRYPDAENPAQLWQNVLAGRRAFRTLPPERMNLADYYSPDATAPDRHYSTKAAVLRNYHFDRLSYRVAGSTFRSTDMTHWLALDVAAQALADAGFPEGEGLPKRETSVVLGNSLTGEFSRANLMRLRWPYVRRTLVAALAERKWSDPDIESFLGDLEGRYKAPFPPIDADTLAGGLSNTIAGRICNHFDLGGGGYTVDGACSSSLLAVTHAAASLSEGGVDVALAGGVDLSLDPFELIGFAKTGALAVDQMRIYDRDSNGFWPGEGCGVIVMMRADDAIATGRRIYAMVTGWGVSSDGSGGITRPDADGHRSAIQRAYRRAGYGVDTVGYFEGHGTGTAVGDRTEIQAISRARREAAPAVSAAALGSIKGNIGHTKAAAGIAGLIKATLAVQHGVIPPATSHSVANPALAEENDVLYVPHEARPWPRGVPVRAGVSAMGFGGINTHIALERFAGTEPLELDDRTLAAVAGRQDAEVLLLGAESMAALRERLVVLTDLIPKLSFAELADLAAELAESAGEGSVRAAIIARSPEEAAERGNILIGLVDGGVCSSIAQVPGVFLSRPVSPARIGFLFPGQGSGTGGGGALRERFREVQDLYPGPVAGAIEETTASELAATASAQPRIVAGSLAAIRVLRRLRIDADVAVGHSLGELSALAWAGGIGESEVLELAIRRGAAMASLPAGGAMVSIAANPSAVGPLLDGTGVVISGYNAPRLTVVSGAGAAVTEVSRRAEALGLSVRSVAVSHAFHSPAIDPAVGPISRALDAIRLTPPSRAVFSTVTGRKLDRDTDLGGLLSEHSTRPVLFHQAVVAGLSDVDLIVEVGPGRVLTGLVNQICPEIPALAVDSDSRSIGSLLSVVAAAFALGIDVDTRPLFDGRVVRPLRGDEMAFLSSPCESVGDSGLGRNTTTVKTEAQPPEAAAVGDQAQTTLDLLRKVISERVELPMSHLRADTLPLDDLHLSSITVGQVVNELCRLLDRPPLSATTNYATVSLGELAEMLDQLAETDHDHPLTPEVAGVRPWVASFAVKLIDEPQPVAVAPAEPEGSWSLFATPGDELAGLLYDGLKSAGLGGGVLLCLPGKAGSRPPVDLMLDAGKAALLPERTRFVVVQRGAGAAGLARSVHLEAPSLRTTVVCLDDLSAEFDVVSAVVVEVTSTDNFSEVHLGGGRRRVPVLRASPAETERGQIGTRLGAADVVLVSGGGKGITAECALALGRDTGAAMILLGRADPQTDTELSANLERFEASGVRVRYERADVSSASQVARVVAAAEVVLGSVTAILHGAGLNSPMSMSQLDADTFEKTIATKVDGLHNILAAVDQDRIVLLVSFGSIIGRSGLRGEAHYATANDLLSESTVRFGVEHPTARALALEWSVWAGAGMGERLGVVETLQRDGITPISADDGIAAFRRILAEPALGPLLVVSGRTGSVSTVRYDRQRLPVGRFLDNVVLHYPGVELITDSTLCIDDDPYLGDHDLDGDLLFPAVLGMEAMGEVAAALGGSGRIAAMSDLAFLRPIVLRAGEKHSIRVAAVVTAKGRIEVSIRSEATGYSADHFRATVLLTDMVEECAGVPERSLLETVANGPVKPPHTGVDSTLRGWEPPAVAVDPVSELYGSVLFQGKRFQRIQAYRRMGARHVLAELSTTSPALWFAPFQVQDMILADPGTRDAVMHALQCCVPDAVLLPESIERIELTDPARDLGDEVTLEAHEVSQQGDSYVYDATVCSDGEVVERWVGLRLRAVRKGQGEGPWVAPLLGPFLERGCESVLGGHRAVVLEPDAGAGRSRRESTELAVQRALASPVTVRYRPDGRPEVEGAWVSASHGAGLTMVVAQPGEGRLSCDLEEVVERGEENWAALLGVSLIVVRDIAAGQARESVHIASTRVWTVLECLRKAGVATQSLAVEAVTRPGWVCFTSGPVRVATFATHLSNRTAPVVLSVLASEGVKHE